MRERLSFLATMDMTSCEFEVAMNSYEPQSGSAVVESTAVVESRMRSRVLKLPVPVMHQQVPLTKPEIKLEDLQTKAQPLYHLRSQASPETPDFRVKRYLTMELPLPSWVERAVDANMLYTSILYVPQEEIDEIQSNDPNMWILTVDTRTLFTTATKALLKYYAASGQSPHRWLITIGGVLAAQTVRPAAVGVAFGFKTQSLTNVALNVSAHWMPTAAAMFVDPE